MANNSAEVKCPKCKQTWLLYLRATDEMPSHRCKDRAVVTLVRVPPVLKAVG